MPAVLDGLLDLRQGDRRDADAGDLALVAQRHHLGQLVLERHRRHALGQVVVGHPAQVDRAEPLDPERAEVVLDTGPQVGGGLGGHPAALGVADGADLGDQHQVVGVGVQGLADQRVRDVGTVVLGGVDVVHAELDRPPEHGDRGVVVARRPEDARAGELHRAEADAVDGRRTEGEGVHANQPNRA